MVSGEPVCLADLYYGQIRATNFTALCRHYGRPPPWPLSESPHISLVMDVLEGRDGRDTAYFSYIRDTHGGRAAQTLRRQVGIVTKILEGKVREPITIEHQSVLDGNHRTAAGIATGNAPEVTRRPPYQTVEFPDSVVEGRRLPGREIPLELRGKVVLDLGCAQGQMSIAALRQGAERVISVDADLRSTTWQLRDAWGFQERMQIICARIEDLPTQDADIVLAMSIVRHVGPRAVARLTAGRVCVLETHHQGDALPSTHRWHRVQRVPYSRRAPHRYRELWVGQPA